MDDPADVRSPFSADDVETTAVDEVLGPGTDVGGYLIDGELGHGGMGVVYSATHPLIGKRAAVKVLKPEMSKDPTAVQRFMLEARAVNQIGHPNIVDIFAFGKLPDGRSYYVMDLLIGESLRTRLLRAGPLHVSEAASAIDETASALIAAHAAGIIHRDLKPDNIFMVSAPGRWPEVKLLDWGVVKLMRPEAGKLRTIAGSVLGTPVYMSPEQARASETVDYRTDIYSLGVMSYELLAGDVPFHKSSSIDTLIAHQEDPVPSLVAKVPSLPDELVQLIEAMLAKDPDDRPTLTAVRTVLKRLKGTKIPTMTAAGLSMEIPLSSPPANERPTIDEHLSEQITGRSSPRPRVLPPQVSGVPLPPPPPAPISTPLSTIPGAAPRPPTPIPYYAQGSIPPPASTLPAHYDQPPSPSFPSVVGLVPKPPKPKRSRRWIVITLAAIVALAIGLTVVLAT